MNLPSVDFVTVSVWLFEHEIQFIEQQRVKVIVQTKFKLDLNLGWGGGVQSFKSASFTHSFEDEALV